MSWSTSGPPRIHGAGLREPGGFARLQDAVTSGADPSESGGDSGGGFAEDASGNAPSLLRLPGTDKEPSHLAARRLSLDDIVLTPSVVPAAKASTSLPNALFRICKAPASSGDVEVPYVITACSETGAVSEQAGLASIGTDRAFTDVLSAFGASDGGRTEIVTLRLEDTGIYQISESAATFFVPGTARGCSEEALLEAYRRGRSAQAFDALVALHQPAVMRTCQAILGNWADAEDVGQFVFLMLAERAVSLQATLAGWLRRVARNASIAFLRARRRRARHEREAAKPVIASDDWTQRELREQLDAALDRLPPRLRDAVRLRYLDGCSQQETAQTLGCPRGTVSQRAARGIARLRAILRAEPNS